MATKKVAKKAAKKAPAKKAAKKAPAKKVAKKAAVKKVAKKAAVKKVAKKAAVKKVAKKAPAKKVAKKAPARKVSATTVAVSTTPVAPRVAAPAPVAPKPAAAPTKKQGGSNRVVLAVVVGILALGAIVLSKGSDSTTSETATPTESTSPSTEATPTESSSSGSVSTTAAPLGIVAKYTADGATIFWNATTAADGLKGYSVEFSSNGGSYSEVATVGTDVTKYDITKTDTEGWTSFKISAVYNDGQKAEGKVFGLPGQYK